jgi:hypothetical protein
MQRGNAAVRYECYEQRGGFGSIPEGDGHGIVGSKTAEAKNLVVPGRPKPAALRSQSSPKRIS